MKILQIGKFAIYWLSWQGVKAHFTKWSSPSAWDWYGLGWMDDNTLCCYTFFFLQFYWYKI